MGDPRLGEPTCKQRHLACIHVWIFWSNLWAFSRSHAFADAQPQRTAQWMKSVGHVLISAPQTNSIKVMKNKKHWIDGSKWLKKPKGCHTTQNIIFWTCLIEYNVFEWKRTDSSDLSIALSLPDHAIVCCGYSFPGIPCETWGHKDTPATVISTTLYTLRSMGLYKYPMSLSLRPTSIPSGILIHSAVWPQ